MTDSTELKPKRIRRSRAKGWKMPPNTVYVGRPTGFGNPFVVSKHGTAADCVELYKALMSGGLCLSTDNEKEQLKCNAYTAKYLEELRGKDLACWCALNKPCHADVLLEIANRTEPEADDE